MSEIKWTGEAGNNNLDDPKNWSSGTVPGKSDDVVFNGWSSNVQPGLPPYFSGTLNVNTIVNNSTGSVSFTQPIVASEWTQANGGAAYLPYNSAIGTLNANNGLVGFTIPPEADATKYTTTVGTIIGSGSGNVVFSAVANITGAISFSGGGSVTAQNGMITGGTISTLGGTKLNVYGDLVISTPIDGTMGHSDGELGKITGSIVYNGVEYTSYDSAVAAGAIINSPGNPDYHPQGYIMGGDNPACYGPETLIEMFDGSHKYIRELEIGDRVHTGATVNWVGSAKVNTTGQPPVELRTPLGRLIVSPNHLMFYMGYLIPAKDLSFASPLSVNEFTYWHFQCDKHSLVKANGFLSESFLNVDGSRGLKTVKGELVHGFSHDDLVIPMMSTF